jgi:hypothetical protein
MVLFDPDESSRGVSPLAPIDVYVAFCPGYEMARVRSFVPGDQVVRIHPTDVECYHQTVDAPDGTRYLHLSTFGSNGRVSGPKSSQSLQLDARRATEPIAIIEAAFRLDVASGGSQRNLETDVLDEL